MLNHCFPESGDREAVEVTRDELSGRITIRLRLEGIHDDTVGELLALLTCWWLRWIATLDCAFFQDRDSWQVQCHLDPTDHAILPQVLRDMLAIKNVCL